MARAAVEPKGTGRSLFERSPAKTRASALGLARFEMAQGLVEQTLAITQQFGLLMAELGLIGEQVSSPSPQAA